MKKDNNDSLASLLAIFIVIILLIAAFANSDDTDTSNGCQLKGTYRNRYVSCSGSYSSGAKRRAERKARECNSSSNPVSGCTSTYR